MLNLGEVRRLVYSEKPLEEAAEELGISTHQMRCARDVLYLWDEPDLTSEEFEPIMDAMRLVVKNKISDARELIDPLMEIRFGGLPRGPQGGPLAARENARIQFNHAVASLTSNMEFAEDIPVPFVSPQDRERLIKEIDAGIEAVEQLKKTIERGGSHVEQQQQ